MIISAMQYKVEQLNNWRDYENKIYSLVKSAKQKNTNLLLLAEYAGLELASWTNGNLQQQCEFIQTQLTHYLELYQTLAAEFQMIIQPGTLPVRETDGFYRNRAYLFTPDKKYFYQDKLFLTPAEREQLFIKPGKKLKTFETAFGTIGIAICYDSEFPQLVHFLAKNGAKLILVPSCTETEWGQTRVSISCRARAIENQCYVAQSPLIGNATWCEFIETNVGQAGIFSPADIGFPDDGILTQGKIQHNEFISAELDWDKLNQVRQQGQVTNFMDMQKDVK